MIVRVLTAILWCGIVRQHGDWVDASTAVANGTGTITGYGFEILMAKLDYLQYKVIELDLGTKENTEMITQNQDRLESVFRSLLWSVTQLDQAVAHNLTNVQDQSRKILSKQVACSSHEQMRAEIARISTKSTLPVSSEALFALCTGRMKGPFRSCKDEPTRVSGKYLLQPRDTDKPFVAFCEQSKLGGGWLVMQSRFDGSLNFNRHWREYREEFGSVDHEYWMGLERMHQLTAARSVELLVEIEDFVGNHGYARYKEFEIGNETEQYPIKKLGAYWGTAGDSLTGHRGMLFSTVDRDNDRSDRNCAARHGGGWWFNRCHPSNLNGYYMDIMDWSAIIWHSFRNSTQGLAYTRMMIREV